MRWTLTRSLADFLAAAGEFLLADPALNTVPLTVSETLRERGLSAFGDDPPWFGWRRGPAGQVDGAFLQTPPYPLLAAKLPPASAGSLLRLLTASSMRFDGANLAGPDEADFSAAWGRATGGSATPRLRSRLFRLSCLAPPDPLPPGAARVAGEKDYDLLIEWHAAFHAEANAAGAEDPRRTVDSRLASAGLQLWEVDGDPVAMAACTPDLAGVVRVLGVYTPPEHRRRGYAGAITTTVSQAALAGGAAEVVLFTDLANPTSNALYQRLGYQPVSDRVLLGLNGSALDRDAAH